MASPRPQSSTTPGLGQREHEPAPAHQSVVSVAERELLTALQAQARPTLDLFVSPSRAEVVAFDHAVHTICCEAHRLDLRAEELLIAIKQAWSQLAAARRSHLGERDGDVFRGVVTSAIEVFFEARDSAHPPLAGAVPVKSNDAWISIALDPSLRNGSGPCARGGTPPARRGR